MHTKIANTVKPVQTTTSSKMTIAESTQVNSHTIVTVKDNHLPDMTSNCFFCPPNEKKPI